MPVNVRSALWASQKLERAIDASSLTSWWPLLTNERAD